ncbi:DNA-binding protein [Thermosphaera sp.]|uniref:DNA-binding protein n=1 Tax=Thermosphaera aggregans TaxID=54254 RepID=A0A7C2BL95_9CREN
MAIYLFSIKPVYAYRVFTGVKKYELRRYMGFEVRRGDRIILYVSGRVKSLMGEFTAGRVITGSPEEVWRKLSRIHDSGVGEGDFKYIKGSRQAMAIEVLNPIVYPTPIDIETLRRILPDFNPPLSMRMLDENDPLIKLIIRRIEEQLEKL